MNTEAIKYNLVLLASFLDTEIKQCQSGKFINNNNFKLKE